MTTETRLDDELSTLAVATDKITTYARLMSSYAKYNQPDNPNAGVSILPELLTAARKLGVPRVLFNERTEGWPAGTETSNAVTNASGIVVLDSLSPTAKAGRLAHELGHWVIHFEGGRVPYAIGDEQRMEVQAEAVAYLVMKHYGVDSTDAAAGYIAGHTGNGGRILQDSEVITEAAQTIINAAKTK